MARIPGRFFLGIGRALYVGPGFHAEPHAHHATQVCVSLDGEIRLRRRRHAQWERYPGAIVPPNLPHELAAEGRSVALLYLEPEGPDAARLRLAPRARNSIARLDDQAVRALRTTTELTPSTVLDGARATALVDEMLSRLGAARDAAPSLDPRIAHALQALRSAPSASPSSVELARAVDLSAGRFRHLFLQQLGLSFRRYRLWLRLYALGIRPDRDQPSVLDLRFEAAKRLAGPDFTRGSVGRHGQSSVRPIVAHLGRLRLNETAVVQTERTRVWPSAVPSVVCATLGSCCTRRMGRRR